MGQNRGKYYTSDDGTIYRINEDGSFTRVGDVNDLADETSHKGQQTSQKTAIHGNTPSMPAYKVEVIGENSASDSDGHKVTSGDIICLVVGLVLVLITGYVAHSIGVFYWYLMILGAFLTIRGMMAIKWLGLVIVCLLLWFWTCIMPYV